MIIVSSCNISTGQYGHFSRPEGVTSFFIASCEMAWPHVSLTGGLVSDVCCLRIGRQIWSGSDALDQDQFPPTLQEQSHGE